MSKDFLGSRIIFLLYINYNGLINRQNQISQSIFLPFGPIHPLFTEMFVIVFIYQICQRITINLLLLGTLAFITFSPLLTISIKATIQALCCILLLSLQLHFLLHIFFSSYCLHKNLGSNLYTVTWSLSKDLLSRFLYAPCWGGG